MAIRLAVLALPLLAERVDLTVETAYLFEEPHAVDGRPDGGSVRITNNSRHTTLTITSVRLSGWVSGATLEWAATGPATLGPGESGVYNQAGPPYLGDTSNFGLLSDPAQGVRIDISGTVKKKSFTRSYLDNLRYAITDGVNTGVDQDFLGLGDTSMPYGPVTEISRPKDDDD